MKYQIQNQPQNLVKQATDPNHAAAVASMLGNTLGGASGLGAANAAQQSAHMPLTPPSSSSAPPSSIHSDALRKILGVGLGAAGGASLIRLLGEVPHLLEGEPAAGLKGTKPTIVDVPYPVMSTEEKKEKRAFDIGKWVRDATIGDPNSQSVFDLPYLYPAAVGTGLTAGAGGFKLTDWVLKKRRKALEESALDTARQKYHRALISQYVDNFKTKSASEEPIEDKISRVLDKIYDLAKQAAWMPPLTGLYGAYALTAGGLAHMATKSYLDSKDPTKAIEDALKEKEKELAVRKAPEVYLRPLPIQISSLDKAPKQLAKGMDKKKNKIKVN